MSNEELNLLNEMKENCLKKGQYIDEKAKDKFNMLCHCEDFIIENYEQKQEIKRLNKEKENLTNIVANKIIKDYDIETPLKDELNKTRIKNIGLESENTRLNNIINELEKSLKERIDFRRKEMIDFEKDIQFSNYEEQKVCKEEMVIRNFEIIELQDTLDKIQELKGDGSNV